VTRATGGGPNSSTSAPANSGNGGAGTGQSAAGQAGGSGVVILRYSSALVLSIGAGLTSSTQNVGSDKVTTITAGSGLVSWTAA
jgi:hypothetical protein